MNNQIKENLILVVKVFINALIVLWCCAILLPVCPWLAAVAGFTYWDWFGLMWGVRIVISYIRSIFHK